MQKTAKTILSILFTALLLCALTAGCTSSAQDSPSDSSPSLAESAQPLRVKEETPGEDTVSESSESSANATAPIESPTSSEAAASENEELLTEEEIKAIFAELDAKANAMIDWANKNYMQIPIEGMPQHEIEEAFVGTRWVSQSPDQPDAGGFQSVYGTVVFVKVTEETLPDFPWTGIDEIRAALAEIYAEPGYRLLTSRLIDPVPGKGAFYQFDDGLYFNAGFDPVLLPKDTWDYESIEVIENSPDRVTVQIYGNDEYYTERSIVKNEAGYWLLLP